MRYSLKEINESVGREPEAFVARCDAALDASMRGAAEKIAAHKSESRVVLLSGASGSGKTTTALKLIEELKKLGVRAHAVSMDDYFKTLDPETAPRNRAGEIDFESPFCLDMELLNRHFALLDEGKTIHIPRYEFAKQRRSDVYARPLRLEEGELAIYEGIHALNDIIVGKNPRAFRVYVTSRGVLMNESGEAAFRHEWVRLCRRLIRDRRFREVPAEFTMNQWPHVQRGERLYVLPYREDADVLLSTSLAYEFSAIKPFAVPLLQTLSGEKYAFVEEILRAFDSIEALDERFLSPTSLVREFVGGSAYQFPN